MMLLPKQHEQKRCHCEYGDETVPPACGFEREVFVAIGVFCADLPCVFRPIQTLGVVFIEARRAALEWLERDDLGAVLCLPPSLLFGHDCKRGGPVLNGMLQRAPQ